MSLEDGCKLIATRGKLIAEKCAADAGKMVAVSAPEVHVRSAIKIADSMHPLKDEVNIAAVNAPQQVVLSGAKEAVDCVVAQMKGIKTREMKTVNHALGSPSG